MGRIFEDKKEPLYLLLIFGLILASYFNALSNAFVYDDVVLVYQNPVIKNWHNIPRLFNMEYWEHAGFQNTGLYRPLTMLSFLFEYSVAGLKPFLYHLDNILLHFLCSVLVYFNLKIILKEDRTPLFTALLFAAHPVHTESVAWVSGRAELLWSFFALLSTLSFLKTPGRPIHKFLAPLFFLLSLLAKEGAFILPALLAAYLIIFEEPAPGQSRASHLFRRLYPYAAVFIIYLPVRLLVLKGFGPSGNQQILEHIQAYDAFLIMCKAFSHYVRLSFLPFSLQIDYLFPVPHSLFEFEVLLPILSIVLTIVFAGRIIRFSSAVFFGILIFFIALLPVSNIIPVGIIMSERAMYIPVLGPCLILGVFLSKVEGYGALTSGRRYAMVILSLILLTFAVDTAERNPYWHDQKGFLINKTNTYKHWLEIFPNYPPYLFHMAETYIMSGGYGPEAEKAAREAARLNPLNYYPHYALAYIYSRDSKPEQALTEIMTSIKLNPKNPDTLIFAGGILHKLHRDDEAERLLDKAFSIGPVNADYYMSRSDILTAHGDNEGALKQLELASGLFPEEPDPYKMQGVILGSEGRYTEAIEKLKVADDISPDDPEIHYLLGVAYFGAGKMGAAKDELRKTLKLDPGYSDASDLLQRIS